MNRANTIALTLLMALGAQCAAAATDPINACLRARQCTIYVTGTLTQSPAMTFNVYRNVWNSWTATDKAAIKSRLGQEALRARTQPGKYADTPKSAPLYPRVIAAIQTVQRYKVVLSSTDGKKSPLKLDEEIEGGLLQIPEVVIPNEKVIVFHTRPLIRASLHDPDSLKNFTVVSVTPQQKDPSFSEVVVGYRARNRMGGVGYQESRFVMSYSSTAKNWLIVPVR